MRKSIRIPALIALSLALTVPALAQSTHQQHAAPAAAPADAAKAAPAVDPDKAYVLNQEYVAKTAELRGKITAKKAELEAQLAAKPDDTAAVKKLVSDIAALRGQLDEQTTLFRIRYAKETNTPIRMTRGFGHMGQMGMMDDSMGMMGGKAKEGCMMMGKGMMQGKGMMMGGQGMMQGMDHGAMQGMDHNAMQGQPQGMNMQAPAQGMSMPAPAADAKTAAPQQAG